MFDPHALKQCFPIFQHHPNVVYLDSAATALKPKAVIEAEWEYYEQYSANVGRGLYPLAETATERFEAVRKRVARFIGAQSPEEIIFTSGTTASINLVAQFLKQSLSSTSATKNIVVTEMEHHSNFLPWKELAAQTHTSFHIGPITDEGDIDTQALLALVDEHTAIVALSAVSNVTGAISPVADIIKGIRNKHPETLILVDAAQASGHFSIDVAAWGADFIAFSGHKMFGPTGIGILYGKKGILETLSPVIFGGGMVTDACNATPRYRDSPQRFEAGTPHIAGALGLGAAIDFIASIGITPIRTHETALTNYTMKRLQETFSDAIHIIGPAPGRERAGIIAFVLDGMHPHDIAALLGEENICVRAGEHCATPLHRALHLNATTRLSFSIYNTEKDIDRLISTLQQVKNTLS